MKLAERRRSSEDKVKTMHMGNGQRAGSDPDVRCGPEKLVPPILLLACADLHSFEFIDKSQGRKAENGQPEIEQPQVSSSPLCRWK